MSHFELYVYTNDETGGFFDARVGKTVTVDANAAATLLVIEDNDGILHDNASFNGQVTDPDGVYSQTLTSDVSIDGAAFSAGSSVTSGGKGSFTNHTTGETGHYYLIFVFAADGSASKLVRAFSIEVNPGETVTYEATPSGTFAVGQESYSNFAPQPICFEETAQIDTPQGPVAAGDLKVGDLVLTWGNKVKPLVWITQLNCVGEQKGAPISIPATIFGGGEGALEVSQAHRVLVPQDAVEPLTSLKGQFVRARHLAEIGLATLSPRKRVRFIHLMLDCHSVVRSNGIWSETFTPGSFGVSIIPDEKKAGLISALSKLDTNIEEGFPEYWPTALRKDVLACVPRSARTIITWDK